MEEPYEVRHKCVLPGADGRLKPKRGNTYSCKCGRKYEFKWYRRWKEIESDRFWK